MAKKKNAIRADGRIAVQVYIGKDSETGKRHYKTVYGATQKEADEKARAVKTAIGKGLDVSAEQDTFGDWSDRWLRIKETEVSRGMMRTYQCALKHLSLLRPVPIAKIRTNDIQGVLLGLAARNPSTGKPSAHQTLLTVKITASQICQLAVDNRVIDYNPVAAIRLPGAMPPNSRRALSQEEQRWIVEMPHRAQTAAMIMMYAGLRRGELLALTWNDIDVKHRTIIINKAVEMYNNTTTIKPMTKTTAGMRTVDIPRVLADFLNEQPKNHLIVCPTQNGKYMTPSAWKRMWESYLVDLNQKYGNFENCIRPKRSKFDPVKTQFTIPKFTAHWLRHTFATLLYFSGVDILTAKEQLGHADVKTTMEIYTHLDSEYKRRSMDKLDDFISGQINNASQMQVK